MDYYSVLGVEPRASQADLKRAYYARAQLLHPDRHQGAPQQVRDEAERGMTQLNEAWEVLGNAVDRERYDQLRGLGREAIDPEVRAAGRGPRANECFFCGSTPVAEVNLRAETGKLLWRNTRELDGPMCRHCGIAVFRQFTSRTLLTGWWGVISFFVNLLTIVRNVDARRRLGRLQPPSPTPDVIGLVPAPFDPGVTLFHRPATYVGPILLTLAITLAASTDDTPSPVESPAPAIAGSCVRLTGDTLEDFVSCDEINDGEVVGVVESEDECPLHTDLYFESTTRPQVFCVDSAA